MKNKIALLLLIIFTMTACANNDSENFKQDIEPFSTQSSGNMDMTTEDSQVAIDNNEMDEDSSEGLDTDRMIIHQAFLQVNVTDLHETQKNIEKRLQSFAGYIVESNVYKIDEEHLSGQLTIRIPAKNFLKFLEETEQTVAQVIEKQVSGEDVTEQYIDLDSRLSSKKIVEERLLDFMKEAKKTEDLLQISAELASVQEEIEVLVGKMKFIENQTDYSTINISMNEVKSGINSDQLNTWEKTKEQFTKSINNIILVGSGFVIFFIGNLPIIIILIIISISGYFIVRRKAKK